MMTYAQFLRDLKKAAKKWGARVKASGVIEIDGGMCALGAVFAGKMPKRPTISYHKDKLKRVGIYRHADTIMRANDRVNMSRRQRQVRRDLLKACGLKERTP